MNKIQRYSKQAIFFFVALFSLWACANIGNPEGGPFDMNPPRLLEASPKQKALNVKGKSFKLKFNEYVKLVQQSEKVIVSPPQKTPTRFTIDGKSIRIHFEDSLKANTTYNIYFDDAIVDNNEDNPLERFTYTFSTGEHIDSMQLLGEVLDARSLEPVPALLVGAYLVDSLNDSTLYKVAFPSAGKTNKMGKFSIRGLRDSIYAVFAIKDNDNNLCLTKGGEGLAFIDKHFKTSLLDSMRTDTIRIDSIVRRDTIHRDSLVTYPYTYYRPDDIILRYFVPKQEKYGIQRYDRIDSAKLELEFLSHLDSIPQLKLIKPTYKKDLPLYPSVDDKVLTCFLSDTLLMKQDSLQFTLYHGKTDSLGIKQNVLDTLTFYKPREQKKSSKKDKDKATKSLIEIHKGEGIIAQTPQDSLFLLASQPLKGLSKESFKLSYKQGKDTIAQPQDFELIQDSLNTLKYNFSFTKAYDRQYVLSIDSAKIHSIYGKACDSLGFNLAISKEEEFANLQVKIIGVDSLVQVELLDAQGKVLLRRPASLNMLIDSTKRKEKKDPMLDKLLQKQSKRGRGKKKEVVDSLKIKKEQALRNSKQKCFVRFKDLKPATYYLRLYLDSNRDGAWTTGDYPNKQPEMVYYCPKEFTLKKGMTQEEEWLVFALPLNKQKPMKLRKVKEEKKQKRVDKNIEYYKRLAEKKSNKKKKEGSNQMAMPSLR